MYFCPCKISPQDFNRVLYYLLIILKVDSNDYYLNINICKLCTNILHGIKLVDSFIHLHIAY